MKYLLLLLFVCSSYSLQGAEIKKYNVSNSYEKPIAGEIHIFENDNDLIDDEEFIVAKEENGCKIVVFHETSGTGFVDKSLCELTEEE